MKRFKIFVLSAALLIGALVSSTFITSDADAYMSPDRSSNVVSRDWINYQCTLDPTKCLVVAGYAPTVTSGTEADLWGGGGEYNWPGTAGAITVISGSANDDAAGTGARTITVSGLNSD